MVHSPVLRHACLEQFLDEAKYAAVGRHVLDKLHRPFLAHVVEEATYVGVEHPVHSLPLYTHNKRVQRLMRATARTEPIGEAFEVDLVNLIEDRHHGLLDDLIFQRRDSQRTLSPIGLRYIDSP